MRYELRARGCKLRLNSLTRRDLRALGGDGLPVGLLLPRGPLLVGGLVRRLEPQVRDDHVVQRADRLTELDPLAQPAGEEGRVARHVGRERHVRLVGRAGDGAAASIGVLKQHGAPPRA